MPALTRNSSFELLRIIIMWMIVLYHFIIHKPEGIVASNQSFLNALTIPLHIGVPVFVLISGYFGIRFSNRGFSRFLSQVAFYNVLIACTPILFNSFGILRGGGRNTP